MMSTWNKIECSCLGLFLFSLVLLLPGCKKEEASPIDCTGLTPTYTSDIRTILDSHCAISGCHNTFSHQEGIDLSNYQDASAASHNANFLGAIQHKKGYQPMPKDAPKLSDSNIQLMTCWVQNGSPE